MSDELKPDPLDLPKDEVKADPANRTAPLALPAYPFWYVRCPRCRGEMVDCDLLLPTHPRPPINQLTIARAIQARNWQYEKVSGVKAIACRDCGYIEMYATQPLNL